MITFNNIVDDFKTFCTNHLQINTFYSGETWNFQTMTNVYPAVIMLPQPSSIDRGRIVLTFNLFIMDILNKDNSNLDEIYSDTLLIMTDMISYFRNNEDEGYSLTDDTVSVEPFNESFDDNLAGWMATLNIEIPYSGSICNLPTA